MNIINRHKPLLNYDGIFKKSIIIKLFKEINSYKLGTDYEDSSIYKINDYLIKWVMRYIKFFRTNLCTDVFVTSYNIIIGTSKLKDYILERIIRYNNCLNTPFIYKIGDDVYITFYKNLLGSKVTSHLSLPFNMETLRLILTNEGLDIGSDAEYALLGIALGSILELLIYIMFNDADETFKMITTSHVLDCIDILESLLLGKEFPIKYDIMKTSKS